MAIVTGDRYLEKLVHFVEQQAGPLIDGPLVLKLNPAGLHYVHSRLEALQELENLVSGAPVDYLRAYVSDLGDYRALEQLRRILRLLTSLKVVSVLPPPTRDPTPLSLLPFERLKVLELRGCDLSTSAARGLLELRHTLEKIVCHNSTDALRHVFASRIVDIKDSPQWNKLSFVSCASNRLVLMDESLQLLPAVETLDLSRNKFAKVDNLRKCVNLKHLDLGFNHLRRIAPFGELKLDDKPISTREYWKRQIIVASRHKRPASFGFYSPAVDDALGESCINKKKQKVCRLASIKSDEDCVSSMSDPESSTCNHEAQSKDENMNSDDEAEIVNLINRVELMKKERSSLWLKELKEWMDPEPVKSVDCNRYNGSISKAAKGISEGKKASKKHQGEGSRCSCDYLQASEDETGRNVFHPNSSFVDVHSDAQGGIAVPDSGRKIFNLKYQGLATPSVQTASSHLDSSNVQRGGGMVENARLSPLSTIDDATESLSSSNFHGSPPHYQKDLLHRRHNLVEEIMQLSADSYSVVSSDTDTTASEDEFYDIGHPMYQVDDGSQLTEENCNPNLSRISLSVGNCEKTGEGNSIHHIGGDKYGLHSHSGQISSISERSGVWTNGSSGVTCNGVARNFDDQEVHEVEKRKSRRKARRIGRIAENLVECTGPSEKSNSSPNACEGIKENQREQTVEGNGILEAIDEKWLHTSAFSSIHSTVGKSSVDSIEKNFNEIVGDSAGDETCLYSVFCSCILETEASLKESEVVLLRSSENKLYLLLIGLALNGTGNTFTLLRSHKIEDVSEVMIGIGLQIVRVSIQRQATYLFLTRSIEKLRQLFFTLDLYSSLTSNETCSFRSLEQVQVELFEKQICGGSRTSIYQYSMVYFRHSASWYLRSLFVVKGSLLVCTEDLKQFGSPLEDGAPSSLPAAYFSLDARCSINDSGQVIDDAEESCCTTLILAKDTVDTSTKGRRWVDSWRPGSGCLVWKLRWFSLESLSNFVALIKASSHTRSPPLLVKSVR
ncbi:unnamed protein product [Linum tenue]|uniref:Uncharacterized protein n=1 Tax=Linum tenue TaxID=586396 RepID=A0AAV0H5M3_9ROSI|nr:unnamed protein product [Linum tenue]